MESNRARLALVGLALLFVAVAALAHGFRQRFLAAIFFDGPGGAPPPALPVPADLGIGDSLPGTSKVRVVLIDGLGLDAAMALPNLSAICAAGHDLRVDAGFPTVSLPVQHALWTGLTQQQSGILFRGKPQILGNPLPPPLDGIPAQVEGSLAVAESHEYIIQALGFHETRPRMGEAVPQGWAFLDEARAAFASDRRLVFVHLLGVDVAGHRQGGQNSPAYYAAASAADSILGELRAVAPDARLFVLSDHGHRGAYAYGPGGGHGSAEPEIRVVRACIAGNLHGAIRPGTYVHLVDMARAIADSLGVTLDERSSGRPLYAAARVPATDAHQRATLPRPHAGRWLFAAVFLALGLFGTLWCARGRVGHLPWWLSVAWLSVTMIAGPVSLSASMVYQPLGRVVYVSALPGLCLLAIVLGLSLGPGRGASMPHSSAAPRRLARLVAAQLVLLFAALCAAAALAGGKGALEILLFQASEPPLMPRWTEYTSVLAVLFYAGAVVGALAALICALRLPRRPA